jgi:hypothetical protein
MSELLGQHRVVALDARVITNDRQWKRLEGIDVVCLSDYCE